MFYLKEVQMCREPETMPESILNLQVQGLQKKTNTEGVLVCKICIID